MYLCVHTSASGFISDLSQPGTVMENELSVRAVELDQSTDLWLAQLDEDADELVNDLLREYRAQSER